MKNGRYEATGLEAEAELNDNGGQERPMKRVKLEKNDDAEVQLLHSIPATDSRVEQSLSAPSAVYEKRLPGRPRKRKRGPRPRTTLVTRDRREQELLNDNRISAVEPSQVLCRMCGSWIKLCRYSDFVLSNWNIHAVKCQERTGWLKKIKQDPSSIFALTIADVPEPPSNVEEIAEMDKEEGTSAKRPVRGLTNDQRKRILEQDKRLKAIEPHQVHCRLCDRIIKLHRSRPYELWNWTQHAKKCESKHISHTVSAHPARDPDIGSDLDSDAEVDAALVPDSVNLTPSVHPIPENPVPCVNGLSATPNPQTTASDIEMDGHGGESNAYSVSTTRVGMKREPSEYAPVVVPYGSSVPFVPPSNSPQHPIHVPSISAPIPKKPMPPAKVADSSSRPSVSASISRHNKKGRNEEERKKALEADPRCSEVRPHEVFCLMCKRWIKLYKEVSYIDSNWLRHAERCELKKGDAHMGNQPSNSPLVEAIPSQPVNNLSVADVIAESSQASMKRVEELRDDPRVQKVEPHQVLCRICKQWIKLQPYRDYDTWNWRKHITSCEERHRKGSPEVLDAEASPVKQADSTKAKNEMSAEERRKVLEGDDRCTEVEPHRVFCLMCRRHTGLHQKKDYSLVNWFKHADACVKKNGLPNLSLSAPVRQRRGTVAGAISESISVLHRRTRATALEEDDIVEISREDAETTAVKAEASGHGKRTIEERKESLLNDPRVGGLEANRIFCKLCDRWLKLSESIPYTPFNWIKHIERCEQRQRGGAEVPSLVLAATEKVPSPVGPSLTAPPALPREGARKRSTAEERHARLRADERIKVLEPHKVQCRICEKWIKLQAKIEYDPYNWFSHVNKCSLKASISAQQQSNTTLPPATPKANNGKPESGSAFPTPSSEDKSPRCNAEERREILMKDPRAAVVEAHRILCAICQQWIKLKEDKAYVGHNFFKHADRCERKNDTSASSSTVVPNSDHVRVKVEEETVLPIFTFEGLNSKDEIRRAELLADPRQGGVEPGRVFCKMCNHWIKLNAATGFLPGNWRRHAVRCQKNSKWQGPTSCTKPIPIELQAVEFIDLELEDEEGPVDFSLFGFVELRRLVSSFDPLISSTEFAISRSDPPKEQQRIAPMLPQVIRNLRARNSSSSVTPKPEETVSSAKRPHRTEASRREELERDRRARVVHPEKILCAMCDKWIQMRRDISYSSQNWLKHAESCQVRSGWLKKNAENQQAVEKNDQEHEQREEEDELLPYNARARMLVDEEEDNNIEALSFKPVDWQQEVIMSEGEDEDGYPISPGVFVPELAPEQHPKELESRPLNVMVKQEPSENLDLNPLPGKEIKSNTLPTPLAFLHLRKEPNQSDCEQNKPPGAVLELEPKMGSSNKSASNSKSPPTNNSLFTTTPLVRPFTSTPPLMIPLAARSMSEFVAAVRAEKGMSVTTTTATDHPYSTGPPFALQPSSVQMSDPLFTDVLTPPPPLFRTIPSPVSGSGLSGIMTAAPTSSASSPFLPVAYPIFPRSMYSGPSIHTTPMQMQTAANMNNNYAPPPERSNGLPTPISAVHGPPRPPSVMSSARNNNAHARPVLPTQVVPYSNSSSALRQIAPAPAPSPAPISVPVPPPSGGSLMSMPTPLSAVKRKRPPAQMPFASPLTPIFIPFMQANFPIHSPPPFPSPRSETSAVDRQGSTSAS